MKIKTVLGNRLLVKAIPPASVSAGGLHLPFAEKADYSQYYVHMVGSDVKEISAGDTVLAPQYTDILFEFPTGEKIIDASLAQAVWKQFLTS